MVIFHCYVSSPEGRGKKGPRPGGKSHMLSPCFHTMYHQIPSGYVKIAIENGPFIVDLPIKNGDFA